VACAHQGLAPQCACVLRHLHRHHRGQCADRPDPGDPLFPILWLSRTLNAVFLPVLLVLVLKLSNNEQLMGDWKNKRFQNILAGGLTGFFSLVTVALLVTSILGWTP